MRKRVAFMEASAENKRRLIKVLPYIGENRKLRTRPRSVEESIGITIATAEVVRNAFSSGRLVRKSPKGFILK